MKITDAKEGIQVIRGHFNLKSDVYSDVQDKPTNIINYDLHIFEPRV